MREHSVFVGTLLFLFGLYFTCSGAAGLVSVAAVKSWPSVEGMLRANDLWLKGRSVIDPVCIPIIKYAYVVDGEYFLGEKISYDGVSAAPRDEIRDRYASYVVGMPVTVRYKPGNPAISVLETGSVSKNLTKAVLGLLAATAGLLLARPAWKLMGSHET